METKKNNKVLRLIVIILVGMTAAMNLLGGIGTTCAAFLTKQFPPMWKLMDFQWLYQFFVVATTLVGIAGIWSLIKLIRGGKQAYKNALIVLVVGAVINIIHVVTSILLRGKATPADVVMVINLVTLAFFLFINTPGMRSKVNFDGKSNDSKTNLTGSVTAIVTGLLVLSTPLWAGPTHQFMGSNWVDLLITPLVVSGGSLLIGGSVSLIRIKLNERKQLANQTRQSGTSSAT
ncbi:MAG: hypothetical protein BGO78_12870 [Chloroflexi bacterium 44-23]|nr:MAG: hypothetical protein BGO78_12870 [Chloroflexi bacterium 44-23]